MKPESSSCQAYALVVGANGTIAQAIIRELASQPELAGIYCFSRSQLPSSLSDLENRLIWTQLTYTTQAIQAAIKPLQAHQGQFVKAVICNGMLHDDQIKPEKRIEAFNGEHFHTLIQANTITPMLWVQALMPILAGTTPAALAVFSARVGSINDNRLGGWYSYRSSKAALNMLLQTAAIEYARRAKNVKLLAFHPGTVNTPLSSPFQKSVSPQKLLTANLVAEKLNHILEQQTPDGTLAYLDWNNKRIEW